MLFPSLKVKYKGKKLDQFKTTWFRKQNPVSTLMHFNLSTGTYMYMVQGSETVV